MNHNIEVIQNMRPEDGWDYSNIKNVRLEHLEALGNPDAVWEKCGIDSYQVWTYDAETINYLIKQECVPVQPIEASPYEVALDLAQHGLRWEGMFPLEALISLRQLS